MISITRRSALRGGGLILAAPLLGSLPTARAASAQSKPSSKLNLVRVSADLAAWVMNQVGNGAAAHFNGTATPTHFKNAGGAMRLCARHMEATGINALVMQRAKQRDLSSIDFSSHPSQKIAFPVVKKYIPDVSPSDISRGYVANKQQIKESQASLATNGISGHYDAVADALYNAARILATSPSYATFDHRHNGAVLDYENYIPLHAPRLMHIQSSCSIQQATCTALANPVANDIVAGFLGIALTDVALMGATAFCASDAALAIASDVLTAGWGLLAAPLEAAVCLGAETGAAWFANSMTIGIGVTAGILIRQLQSSIGCSSSS
jgi:hypothetical protein